MAKQPALITRYKAATKRILELESKVAELDTKVKQLTDSNAYNSKQASEANAMLEQVQQVLDAVPNSISRESEGENSWDRVKRSPLTRLAAWLAIRNHKEQ